MNNSYWDLGEFVMYQLEESDDAFKITIEGSKKYMKLLAIKVNEIKITDEELRLYTTSEES